MRSKTKPIVVVGSINIDLVVTAVRVPLAGETLQGDKFEQHFGGKGANQAVAVARLGYPAEMIGRVGSDSLGSQALESLRRAGVGVDAVEAAEGSSGIACISVSRTGENAIVIVPGANAQVTPEYLDKHEECIRAAGMVLAQLEIPMPSIVYLAELCRRHHIPLILDPAPAQPIPCEVLASITWFTPNETEAEFYAGGIHPELNAESPLCRAEAFLKTGVRSVALKLGARGVLIAPGDSASAILPGVVVHAVDTTAAGDAFNGAFATALMRGMKPLEAGRFACAAAAISVTRRGAQSSMPGYEAVMRLLQCLA
jgi:ribokinase